MEWDHKTAAEAKLKALIRHLVLSFPQTSILSRQVGESYHVFVIVPYGSGPEKAIQVDRALLLEQDRSVEAFDRFLSGLNLPSLLATRARYTLNSANRPVAASGRPNNRTLTTGLHAQDRVRTTSLHLG